MTGKDTPNTSAWTDPLTHLVPVASVPSSGLVVTLDLDAAQRTRLAAALDLESIPQLKADYRLTPRSGGIFLLTGELRGMVRPVCVVSLEAFDFPIREAVDMRFAEPASERRRARVQDEDILASDDPPDEIVNGAIDLGKVTTEFLSLALPIYPRRPDAEFAKPEDAPEASPFSALSVITGKES